MISHNKTLSSLLLLCYVTCSIGYNSTTAVSSRPRLDGRIVGGRPISIREAPYQVSLQRGYHICGGSLLSKQIVLTAAHCTSSSSIQVRIGSTYSTWGGVLVPTKKVTRHPQYNSDTLDYDFAILEIEDYSTRGIVSGYIRLPIAFEDVADNTLLTISGWGQTKNPAQSSTRLRAVDVPKVNQEKCNSTYGTITDRMLCAGYSEGGRDSCQGDSGGPMVREGVLVGVVSWGYGCAKPHYPGVYARVAAVRQWITEEIGI